jgi:hypothetical protein
MIDPLFGALDTNVTRMNRKLKVPELGAIRSAGSPRITIALRTAFVFRLPLASGYAELADRNGIKV